MPNEGFYFIGILQRRLLARERVRGVAVKNLGAFHQRFGERRMRMHGQRDVLGSSPHFHRERRLANSGTGVSPVCSMIFQ